MCKAIYEWIEEGREEGLREGLQRGEQSKAEKIARNMFQRGMSVEDVAAICEEDVKLVEQWFEKNKKRRKWFGLVG